MPAVNSGHIDANQNPSITGVIGTLGTADTGGTALTLPIGVNPLTGAMYVEDLSGAAGTTNVSVLNGTINRVHDVGTINVLPNIPGGTLALVTTVTNLSNGTIQNSGTTTGVGVVTAITNGTIRVEAGTITRLEGGSVAVTDGTVQGNIASGVTDAGNPVKVGGKYNATLPTLTDGQRGDIQLTARGILRTTLISSDGATQMLAAVDNADDVTPSASVNKIVAISRNTVFDGSNWDRMYGDSANGVDVDVTRLPNIPGGTVGLVTTVSNLTNGTVAVSAGTVRVNTLPLVASNVFGTTSAATIGTIISAPSAGSAILIDSIDVSAISGTAEVVVSYGLVANGNGVVTRGLYPAGGGISKNPTYPIGGSITGSALTWNTLSGSGTVAISVAYRIQVP